MSTCGDPDCALPAGHGGDFHVGPEKPDGTRDMWARAASRAAVRQALGDSDRFSARLTVPDEGVSLHPLAPDADGSSLPS